MGSPERVRKWSTHLTSSLAVRPLTRIMSRWPFRYSPTMYGSRCRRGFRYTTMPGFSRAKFTSSRSMYSRIPRLLPCVLQKVSVSLWSWHTYRPTPLYSGALMKAIAFHVRESRRRAKTGWLREFAPESKKALAFLAVCAGVTVECGVDWCKLCKAFSALVHHAPASGQRASAAALQRRSQSSPELTPPGETISDQLRQYTTALASLAPAPKNCDVECRVRRFRENRAATDAYKIRHSIMSEYCLQTCSTNRNIMFVRTREPIADDVFSPESSPKRLCLDLEPRTSCDDVDNIARIMTPTPPSESPVKRPLQDVTPRHNNSGSSSPSLPPSPGTPTKSSGDFLGSSLDPMTPTARLKLLSCLAAERLPYASGENGVDDELSNHSSNSENQKPTSRKDKSLGLLCQAFLKLYPEYTSSSDHIIVSLDEVAKHLGVERRRVYDIVNVLESVGMVTKEAKNKYRWFGKGALLETLPKLKSNEAINSGQVTAASMGADNGGGTVTIQDLELRREKSMGIMSQRFLMLFLTSPPKTVSLDLAAKVLIGDPTVDKTQSLVYKTKIRRLYDIANILTSLGLIRKVTVTESRGRKSAFKYIGPDIGSANTDEG
ncbi:hypothetical protein HPB49_020577 [Dermacentor silvarum]|uniref:Uncharacterized protein n=1 Tax=Dermacentor silvarum TaxID=543639 RepID=A0ACB8C580_DERSI|nr:hypothetical protein HPB49_020577 [Dermacentor silvarum]